MLHGQDGFADFVGSAHRDRGLVDDNPISLQTFSDTSGYRQNIFQISGTVIVGWRSNRNELKQAMLNRFINIGRELQTLSRHVALDDGIQTGFVNGYLAPIQALDLTRVHINA